jgi:hypothetical protein
MHVNTLRPSTAPSAWHTPMVVVDLPSPRGVGLMPVTWRRGEEGGGGGCARVMGERG